MGQWDDPTRPYRDHRGLKLDPTMCTDYSEALFEAIVESS